MNRESPKKSVVILEDSADVCKLLRFILEKEFEVVFASNGAQLCRMVDKAEVDVIVLHIGLPEEDGISIAQQIRNRSSLPLIFLSGNLSEEMIVKGLNVGGDDYVTKPFQPEVLRARIRNALRHGASKTQQSRLCKIQLGNVKFEVHEKRLLNSEGSLVHLTEMEVTILCALVNADNQTLAREELFRRIYGRDWDLLSRTLEVHISHLRKKLTEASGEENAIIGLRGIGFRLTLEQVKISQSG